MRDVRALFIATGGPVDEHTLTKLPDACWVTSINLLHAYWIQWLSFDLILSHINSYDVIDDGSKNYRKAKLVLLFAFGGGWNQSEENDPELFENLIKVLC